MSDALEDARENLIVRIVEFRNGDALTREVVAVLEALIDLKISEALERVRSK